MARLPFWSAGPARGERPARPFTGYKLARAVVSADGLRTGFVGLTLGATRAYGVVGDADCVWNRRHVPPRRWCGCGFYCLHALADARGLACATENRAALLLEVAASGRYIRYERGLRYSRQRVRSILDAQCGCGAPAVALTDTGGGMVGWRHLAPACGPCTRGRPELTLRDFTARLDGPVRIAAPLLSTVTVTAGAPVAPAAAAVQQDLAAESPIAVLAAEIALLHARLDDLQSRLDR